MKSCARFTGTLLVLLLSTFCAHGADRASAKVNVILWFDTEDYLLKADDDAAKRLAVLLTERNIRATFKVVGEKARVLEKRGRQDVIAALQKHDIGYHANFHSVHPTPTEYLADCGWLEGIAEFTRREGGGAADVRRIFNVETLSCYGQPGSSWAPQAVAALKGIGVAPHGIPCYVDEGTQVGLNEKPFWYLGTLNVFHMGQNYTRMELHKPDAVEPAKKLVSEMADRLKGDGGGLISIFYHPCEWVHQEFWDGVNFKRGANPPREAWKPPGQLSAEETEGAFKRFEQYIDHIRTIPNLSFVTASDLPVIYPDRAVTDGVSKDELLELAKMLTSNLGRGVDFQILNGTSYSVADQFQFLAKAVADVITTNTTTFPIRATRIAGPDHVPPATALRTISWPAFRDAVLDVNRFVNSEQRIPARVFIGSDPVAPADFLIGLAFVFQQLQAGMGLPKEVTLGRNVALLPVRFIGKDTPGLYGGWIIHKEGFRAPKLVEMAGLQSWTLKPAMPARVQ